jgi:DNA-binding response OmpR family regulator
MSSNPASILIVDDSRSLVHIIDGVLQREGYKTCTAYDGEEGLARARQEKPDLIILDIVMPKMDGYTVCRHLQQDPETAGIPILMLTVKGQLDERPDPSMDTQYYDKGIQERMAGFEVGATEFMSKPVSARELLERVKSLLWLDSVGPRR